MKDNSQAIAASMVGAILGSIAGYLFFTPRGRQLRRRMEPALEDMATELNHFRATVMRASSVASEGWKLLNSHPHQTSPF